MTKSVESTRHEFGSVRTGRASPALLDRIMVDYYGTSTALKQLATISAPEPRRRRINPYERRSSKRMERPMREQTIGLTPSRAGTRIRQPNPRLPRDCRSNLFRWV